MGEMRGWVGQTVRYGTALDHVDWKVVIDHYYWDRIGAAHDLAAELGVGSGAVYGSWYRTIEAENLVRHDSVNEEIAPWLKLEHVPQHTFNLDTLGGEILSACDHVAQRFGWDHRAETLVTVLTPESDAPWVHGRFGYCVDKYPYEKICIPYYALNNASELQSVIAHEYAHVIVLNAAQGSAPRWLDEAIAMLAEGSLDEADAHEFATGAVDWLSVDDLNHDFVDPQATEDDVYLAYQQSALIGRYLHNQAGDEGIVKLLEGFSNNSNWTELKMRITGQTAADEALREVYGLSERETFDRTLEWVKQQYS